MKLLEVNNVSKRFGGLTANEDVTFTVDSGQIVGLIGPNGAGKTDALQLCRGLLRADLGLDHAREAATWRANRRKHVPAPAWAAPSRSRAHSPA